MVSNASDKKNKGELTEIVDISSEGATLCVHMDKLTALWQGASYQDKLLQSYRGFNIAIQSVFLLTGAGLTITTLAFGNSDKAWLTYSLLVVITVIGIYFLLKIQKLIASRSKDVNYFQAQIIEYEKSLPRNEQVLTAFKVYQKFDRANPNPDEHFLNFLLDDSIRKQLIEKDKGHTRQILDRYLYWAFQLFWVSFHLIALMGISTSTL